MRSRRAYIQNAYNIHTVVYCCRFVVSVLYVCEIGGKEEGEKGEREKGWEESRPSLLLKEYGEYEAWNSKNSM